MIWNKKKSNALMILEILLSFLVLFVVIAYMNYNFQVFSKPLGFDCKNIKMVLLDDMRNMDSTTASTILKTLESEIPSLEYVEGVAFSGQIFPFSGSTWQTGGTDSLGTNFEYRLAFKDHLFADLMNMKILQGRWFEEGDEKNKYRPVLVNQNFAEKYYPGENVVGKILNTGEELEVIGVYEDYRYMGEFEQRWETLIYYRPYHHNAVKAMYVRLENNTPASFEERLYQRVADITKSSSFTIVDLEDRKISNSKESWIPIITLMVLCGFLCINVALGLFGILWYNINKRKSEIGLRMALGAHTTTIRKQFILEIIILTFIGVTIASLFAIQIPLLDIFDIPDILFYKSLLEAMAIILTIVVLCALYPSIQASRISPSIALHED